MFPIQRYTTSHVTGIVISCHYLFFVKSSFSLSPVLFSYLFFFLLFKKCFDAPDKVKTSGEWNSNFLNYTSILFYLGFKNGNQFVLVV